MTSAGPGERSAGSGPRRVVQELCARSGVYPSMEGRQRFGINVTPYIDILLVLLIIFMVIQPTRRYSLNARTAGRSQSAGRNQAIVISIGSDFQLRLNSEPVSFPRLGARLFEILKGRADASIFVAGAPDLSFGGVARVIDIAKGAGAGRIGLLLGQGAGSPPHPAR